ncbi:hypothetical protein Goshw_009885, partial [Gossypium schwendimanii]|nr:hypothetical protein [Gossypium schwendimanii]
MFFSLKSPSSNLPFLSFESKPPKSPQRSPLLLLYYPSSKLVFIKLPKHHQIATVGGGVPLLEPPKGGCLFLILLPFFS